MYLLTTVARLIRIRSSPANRATTPAAIVLPTPDGPVNSAMPPGRPAKLAPSPQFSNTCTADPCRPAKLRNLAFTGSGRIRSCSVCGQSIRSASPRIGADFLARIIATSRISGSGSNAASCVRCHSSPVPNRLAASVFAASGASRCQNSSRSAWVVAGQSCAAKHKPPPSHKSGRVVMIVAWHPRLAAKVRRSGADASSHPAKAIPAPAMAAATPASCACCKPCPSDSHRVPLKPPLITPSECGPKPTRRGRSPQFGSSGKGSTVTPGGAGGSDRIRCRIASGRSIRAVIQTSPVNRSTPWRNNRASGARICRNASIRGASPVSANRRCASAGVSACCAISSARKP